MFDGHCGFKNLQQAVFQAAWAGGPHIMTEDEAGLGSLWGHP